MKRISFLLRIIVQLLSAIVAVGLGGNALGNVETPALQCVNNYTTEFPQLDYVNLVVLTDAGTSTGTHNIVVTDNGTPKSPTFYFNVATGGSVSGTTTTLSSTVTDSTGSMAFYRSVVGTYTFTGNDQAQPSFLEGPPANIAPYTPAVDVLNFALGGNTQQIVVTSNYSYSNWKDIGPFIIALPYTPGASGYDPMTSELIFDLRTIKQDGTSPFTCPGGCSSCVGPHRFMAGASLDRFHAGITINDTPISYTPGVGMPMNFTITYQQRLNGEPTSFTASNLGPQWRAGWISSISGGPTDGMKTTAVIHDPSGSTYSYGGYQQTGYYGLGAVPSNTGDFTNNNAWTHASLHYRQSPERYELWQPDGSVQTFAQAVGTTPNRNFYLTSITDPQGNVTKLAYDPNAATSGQAVLTTVTDPTGGQLLFTYSASDPLKIVKVTRSKDGLSAKFQYASGHLTGITDTIGITSAFHYASGTNFIDSMTTPYGKTTFSSTDGPGVLEADMTNPLSQTERVEYRESLSGTYSATDSPVPTATGTLAINNSNLDHANTFYWTRRAMADAAAASVAVDSATFYSNYAQVTHWAQSGAGSIPVPLSTKMPLESRVWFNYPGQSGEVVDPMASGVTSSPSATARVLDDSSTQASFATYNANGMITQSIDPLGRTTNYHYAINEIDLLDVKQVNGAGQDTLSTMTYNSVDLPLTVTDASGQTTTMTYNSQGQLLTRTNAKGETTTLAYDSNGDGYLHTVTGPVSGATTTYTYDSVGRVQTVTDSEGYIITTAYDNLDRPKTVTYPDSTTDQTIYNALDVVKTVDRQGRVTYNKYDAIRELLQTTDPLGRTTKYSWCTCGGLSTLTDANGNVTTWGLDLQGRVTSKTYADSSAISYVYETNTSRLHTMTDACGSVATYTYNEDNTLAGTAYAPGSGVAATPGVNFGYDLVYNRVTYMADGTGTTTYSYATITGSVTTGAGRLSSVVVPIATGTGTVTYSYDELGRVTGRDIDHVATGANDTSTTFDSLGRVTGVTNALGAFTYAYVNTTSRLSSVTYPSGTGLSTLYSYFNNAGDQRLQTIQNKQSSTQLSRFDYTYNPVGTISSWTQQADSSTAVVNTLSYDNADQLIANVQTGGATAGNKYNYDPAGNRLAETTLSGTTVTAITGGLFNNVNQLTNLTGTTSTTTVSGTTSLAASSVIVNGVNATVTGTAYSATIPTITGTNILNITAKPTSGAPVTQRFAATISGSTTTSLAYDANGNTTTDENGNTYQWDALNRLTAIVYPGGTHTEFAYDGLSRRVQIVERAGTTVGSGTIASTKNYLWVGSEIAEERDVSNTVTKRFFSQGEQQSGTNYYYTRDHLLSIREMVDGSGSIAARYAYDPYGRQTKMSGSLDSTFQFTGDYRHATSGLYLTKFRAYDSTSGRWLSRDPIKERGGINLYGYCRNDATNFIDQLGLDTTSMTIHITPGKPFTNPTVDITAKSDCCKNIAFIQYTNARYLFAPFGSTHVDDAGGVDGLTYGHDDPAPDGSVTMHDAPGPGTEDGGLGGFVDNLRSRVKASILGALIQEFVTCAICKDPGPHYNQILMCIHWRVGNDGIYSGGSAVGPYTGK